MDRRKSRLIGDYIYKKYKVVAVSALFLAAALTVEHALSFSGQAYMNLSLYGLSYLAVGVPMWGSPWKASALMPP